MSLRVAGGALKGRRLAVPKGSSTRPTQAVVREAVFNICQGDIEGAAFLDLYAGSGAMGIEALSRGARFAAFVEKDQKAVACLRKNLAELKLEERSALFACEAMAILGRGLLAPNSFEIAYLDPPYETPLGPLLERIAASHVLKEGGILFVEERERGKEGSERGRQGLIFLDTRRFGAAWLHRYRVESR